MKKLNRPLPGPVCLDSYKHGRDNWSSLNFECKQRIREELWSMQGEFCAYCERQTPHKSGHIEHFIQKGRVPSVTFDWKNLFWSCLDSTTCGKHKDHKANNSYADRDLIKPDVDDPSDFFSFSISGEMFPKRGASESIVKRATETIRVFNLNDLGGSLKSRRAMAFKTWEPEVDAILELIEEEEDSEDAIDLFEREVDDLFEEIQRLEFSGSTSWLVRNALAIL